MTKLNYIELYWHRDKGTSLAAHITRALERWNEKKDTRDFVPEWIVFPLSEYEELMQLDYPEFDLIVKFEKNVQKNHFKIRGKCY